MEHRKLAHCHSRSGPHQLDQRVWGHKNVAVPLQVRGAERIPLGLERLRKGRSRVTVGPRYDVEERPLGTRWPSCPLASLCDWAHPQPSFWGSNFPLVAGGCLEYRHEQKLW